MKKYNLLIALFLIIACKNPSSQTQKAVLKQPIKTITPIESIVFITGYDKGDNTYYSNAKNYFKAQKTQIVDELFSINEIINYLNQNPTKIYDKIHIVSHSNPWLGMSLKTTKNGKRITLESLSEAIKKKEIPHLKNSIVNTTKIIFHSCGLGENKALLAELKDLFTTEESPKIVASSFFNVFGGKYAGHYLAKPYYGYYPTAESPGLTVLSNEFKNKYPNQQINWFTALKTRKEADLGEVYSYKFNIPVDWEFTFDKKEQIPVLKNKVAIMDWVSESPEMAEILYTLDIPIEKYRWKSKVRGNKLYIKGKTTVLCVLEPVLQENDITEYKNIAFNDTSLYTVL